ncbi:DUF4290 domain-containing protein [Adhaeribacter radiodurans]|uniref:DUF4290 domain-containing protein n=1 Tax=Adhaeribacter radiodurans TaxID=2745197 RepID=A0A7L7L3W9_9BACT|nr:DUF4290 domain-containing protein [Adhaeribacter radiodurans]QMU27496.1 DUF4290 domain-containing protein [Adhaeribacter radiodurans]
MIANSSFKQELLLREYGRNVQNIVSYILSIEDRAQRSRSAQLLVNLMAKLNPSIRDIQDMQQKLWNHLFVMSDGKLDVDCPYPLSAMEYLNDKPSHMEIPRDIPKYKHYGKNVEHLINKAIEIKDKDEQDAAIISLGKLMKTLYRTYNKDSITDEIILNNIRELSGGKLNMDLARIEANNLFEVSAKAAHQNSSSNNNNNNNRKKMQDNKQQQRKKQQ